MRVCKRRQNFNFGGAVFFQSRVMTSDARFFPKHDCEGGEKLKKPHTWKEGRQYFTRAKHIFRKYFAVKWYTL